MKKIFLSIILFSISFSPLLAQVEDSEPTEESTEYDVVINEESAEDTSSNSYFDLELVRGTQNPLNKEIPFTIYITPKLDSPRTQILWDVPIVFTLKTKHSEFVDLEQDQTYSYQATVKPNREGSFNIAVNVISWQYDTNKTNTVESKITLNRSLTVQPVDSQYTLILLTLVVSGILLTAVGVFVVIKLTDRLIIKLKKWLTPPF